MSESEPKPADKSVNQTIEYLEGKPEAYDVRTHKYTVDFTVGDPGLWPNSLADDELNVIRSSSVSYGGMRPHSNGKAVQGNPQTGSNIHLPPAREHVWEVLEERAGFGEKFTLVNGSFQLGSLLPPPDGICTPHVIITEDAEVSEVTDALDECFRLYENVYDSGSEVIKTKP